jgi:hypothetical protein
MKVYFYLDNRNVEAFLVKYEARWIYVVTLSRRIRQKNKSRIRIQTVYCMKQNKKILQRLIIQQENKSRVLLYRNVFLSLIVHICIVAMHSCFIGCLPLEKSIINQLLIINTLTHFTTYCGIIVAHNYRKRP